VDKIKLTSKRQATFPVKMLKSLGLRPGDELEIKSVQIKGEQVWLLRPRKQSLSWCGALSKYADRRVPPPDKWRELIGSKMAGSGK
jgi:bifunctional DNA-binding transcriptional regulator/antitoxin component of YhaV-PrlF toxin-antitoxin module